MKIYGRGREIFGERERERERELEEQEKCIQILKNDSKAIFEFCLRFILTLPQ